jgi:hypothetical protein
MVFHFLSIRLLKVSSMSHRLSHGIRAGSLEDDGHFPPDVEYVFGQKLSHVRERVKVSYITKRYMTKKLYKS